MITLFSYFPYMAVALLVFGVGGFVADNFLW